MTIDYEQLVKQAPDAIVVADDAGVILDANDATARMLGWSVAELRGRALTDLMPARYRAAHQAGLARYLATGRATLIGRTVEVEALHRDGAEVRVELSLAVLPGPRPRFAGIMRDLARVQTLAQAVDDARAEAQRLDEEVRLRDEFLATASHELATPLATMKMHVDLLERGAAGAGGVVRLRRQVERLERLIKRMLDSARIASGSLAVTREPVDLAALATDLVADVAPAARRHPIALELPEGAVWVEGDADQLGQVVFNLLDNAVKYSPEPRPIRVVVSGEADRAVLRVQDQGIGIPAALQRQLFARFIRERSGRVRSIAGLGVGLYISRAIVEAHGGTLTFESEEGVGTTFVVTLPHLDRPDVRAAARHVLVVDDDRDLLDTLVEILAAAHIPAEAAGNGAEALASIQRSRPAAVVLDLMMPVMDGWECCRRIRADAALHDLPVIVCSGDGNVQRKAAELGATAGLSKPVEVAELLALLRVHLDARA